MSKMNIYSHHFNVCRLRNESKVGDSGVIYINIVLQEDDDLSHP